MSRTCPYPGIVEPPVVLETGHPVMMLGELAGTLSGRFESGLLAAQGLVWFAKLAALRGEDYTAPRSSQFVDRFS